MINAILVNPNDSVAIVNRPIERGEWVEYVQQGETRRMEARDPIPIYHKISLQDIAKGQPVIKYGEAIGLATQDIRAGDHVHTHNLSDIYD